MKYEQSQLDNYLYDRFGQDKIVGIADNVISRYFDYEEGDDFDEYDRLYDCMNDELMYYDDQWSIMQYYQQPSEANFDDAWDSFSSDLLEIIRKLG